MACLLFYKRVIKKKIAAQTLQKKIAVVKTESACKVSRAYVFTYIRVCCDLNFQNLMVGLPYYTIIQSSYNIVISNCLKSHK